MSETYEAVQTIGGRWEIRGHHDDCAEGIPLNEAEIRRAVACLYACAGIPTEALEAGKLEAALEALVEVDRADNSCDEYRPQCPWCGASGRGGYMSSDEEEPHAPGCKRTAALRALGRLP